MHYVGVVLESAVADGADRSLSRISRDERPKDVWLRRETGERDHTTRFGAEPMFIFLGIAGEGCHGPWPGGLERLWLGGPYRASKRMGRFVHGRRLVQRKERRHGGDNGGGGRKGWRRERIPRLGFICPP